MACCGTFLYVPVTPEIISATGEQIKAQLKFQFNSEKEREEEFKKIEGVLADKASALNNIAFGVGSMIGPILGGLYTDLFGYQNACNL